LKFTKLGPVFAALVLAACQDAPPPAAVAEQPPQRVGPSRGIDIPTDASDILGELKTSRLDFVARYYRDPASRWPTLSPDEVQRLSSLGLKIVTVWESHSRRPDYFSYASGYYDALSAYRQAKAVAQSPGSAIYFAVDFNARGYDLYQVDQYFRGVYAGFAAAGNGRPDYKIGVYGSGAVCAMIKGERLAQYSWLSGSTAWEGSSGYTGWNIRQADQGARWAHLSFVHDANEATEDFGGFQLAGYDATPASAVAAASPNPTDTAQQAPEPDRSLVGMIKSWF
jgi:glycoside hydrolase-like protein